MNKWTYRVTQDSPNSRYNEYKNARYISDFLKRILKVRPWLLNHFDTNSTVMDVKDSGRAFSQKLLSAIRNASKVLVWGDFDIDGITATVSLVRGIEWLGCNYVTWALTDKIKNGYGICVEDIERILSGYPPRKCVIVTCDNGITENEKIISLQEKGYTVFVTDHHLNEDSLPSCEYYDPKCMSDISPSDNIYPVSGCCVAICIVREMLKQAGITLEYDQEQFLDILAGLSIVSDVIDITPAVSNWLDKGLVALQTTTHDGLRSLLEICGMKDNQPITSIFLAYSVLPKLNAACRMGKPQMGAKLLLAKTTNILDKQQALLQASSLNLLNTERKNIENKITQEAMELAELAKEKTPYSLVLYKPGWHEGVIGIVASKICEIYHIPVLVLTDNQDKIVGSGRAPSGYNLYEAIKKCEDMLLRCGGHVAACGVTLELSKLNLFTETLNKIFSETPNTYEVLIDTNATIGELNNIKVQMEMLDLQPFGKENEAPVVCIKDVQVISADIRKSSLNLTIRDNNDDIMVITKYEAPEELSSITINSRLDVVVFPMYAYFTGTTTINWKIIDVRRHDGIQIQSTETTSTDT